MRAIGAVIIAVALLLAVILVALAPLAGPGPDAVPGRGVHTIPAPGPNGGPPS